LNSSLKTAYVSIYMLRKVDKFHLKATQLTKKNSEAKIKMSF